MAEFWTANHKQPVKHGEVAQPAGQENQGWRDSPCNLLLKPPAWFHWSRGAAKSAHNFAANAVNRRIGLSA
jgi:hypothetical protein